MTKLCAFVPNVMCNGVIIVEASDFTIYKSKNLFWFLIDELSSWI